MALQGTIKDFALPDIFQLIGIQRKTGLLVLENDTDTVSLKFLEGQIVGADTSTESLEDRLGELLVRTGRITQAQLQEALRLQKQTLRRLGHILVDLGYIEEEGLVEALRVQSSQIIYRLFRWRDGKYRFTAAENLDYDENHFTPISSETVLMEGARMMDEWPIIERRIRSDRIILRKTEAAAALDVEGETPLGNDSEFEADRPEQAGAQKSASNPGVQISTEEREVLLLVDGKRPVRAICDLLPFGEFDACRILSDLMTKNLLAEVGTERVRRAQEGDLLSRIVSGAARAGVFLLALVSLATLSTNPWTPGSVLAHDPTTERIREYVSFARLEKLDQAIRVFYLEAGEVPGSLEVLVSGGYVREAVLRDPWGRAYGFEVSPGGYRVAGLDAAGEPSAEFTISRRFTPVQQMLRGEGAGSSGTVGREP